MDSLKKNIADAKGNDSLQAERYIDLAFEIYSHSSDNLEKGIENINKAIALSKKKPYVSQLISEYNYTGSVYNVQGKSKESIIAYQKALNLAEKEYETASPERKSLLDKHIPYIKGNIAGVYNRQGKLDKALAIRLSVIENLEKQHDKEGLALEYGNIASEFMQAKKYQKAIQYANKGISVYKDQNGKSLPVLYGNLGLCYNKLGMLDSALHYYLICRAVSKDRKQLHMDNEADIAMLYARQKKYNLSNQTFDKLFAEFENDSKSNSLNYYKLQAAESYMKQDNYSKASQLFNQSKDNIVTDQIHERMNLALVGMKINRHDKNYKEALRYADLYHEAKNSMNNAQRDSAFHLIESKYNVAKKQETINAQKIRLRNISLGLFGVISLAVFAGLLFYNYRKKVAFEKRLSKEITNNQKVKIENLEKENKIISMQSMLEGQEEERKRIARDLHDNIGTLMTSIKMKMLSIQKEVENIEKMNIAGELDGMIDNASQEVRRISHSMTPVALDISGLAGAIRDLEPQLAAKNIDFTANLEALNSITDKNLSINIYRIIQEIFNNIVKHSQANIVSVDASIRENNLILRVRDNGVGIPKEVWQKAKSVGIESLKSRVNYLNGEIKLVTDIGTHYKITIPTV